MNKDNEKLERLQFDDEHVVNDKINSAPDITIDDGVVEETCLEQTLTHNEHTATLDLNEKEECLKQNIRSILDNSSMQELTKKRLLDLGDILYPALRSFNATENTYKWISGIVAGLAISIPICGIIYDYFKTPKKEREGEIS